MHIEYVPAPLSNPDEYCIMPVGRMSNLFRSLDFSLFQSASSSHLRNFYDCSVLTSIEKYILRALILYVSNANKMTPKKGFIRM
jgi:hypothetical protein